MKKFIYLQDKGILNIHNTTIVYAVRKRRRGVKVKELTMRLDNLLCVLILVFLFVNEPRVWLLGLFNKC